MVAILEIIFRVTSLLLLIGAGVLFLRLVVMAYRTDGPPYPLKIEGGNPLRSAALLLAWLGAMGVARLLQGGRAALEQLYEASAELGEWCVGRYVGVTKTAGVTRWAGQPRFYHVAAQDSRRILSTLFSRLRFFVLRVRHGAASASQYLVQLRPRPGELKSIALRKGAVLLDLVPGLRFGWLRVKDGAALVSQWVAQLRPRLGELKSIALRRGAVLLDLIPGLRFSWLRVRRAATSASAWVIQPRLQLGALENVALRNGRVLFSLFSALRFRQLRVAPGPREVGPAPGIRGWLGRSRVVLGNDADQKLGSPALRHPSGRIHGDGEGLSGSA